MAEQGGDVLSVRDAALDLAEVLMGEMLNPIAALTRKTLGGTAEQADGLLAAMVYSLATEEKEAPRGPDDSTPLRGMLHERSGASPWRSVGVFGPTGRTAHRQSGRG